MIQFIKYTRDLARELGVKLADVKVVEGCKVGCLDTHLLTLTTVENRQEHVLVYQKDIDAIAAGERCSRLEMKMAKALKSLA